MSMRTRNGSLTSDLVKGAIAGAVGTWAMDRVTTYLYAHQDPSASQRETDARVDGKSAYAMAAEKTTEAIGADLSDEQQTRAATGIHWTTGLLFGAAHSALRNRVPGIGAGHGIVHGLIFYVLLDEVMNPMLGLTAGPTAFPWQTHARGLAGHVVLGGVTDTVLDVLH